jgi:hypothetical protein
MHTSIPRAHAEAMALVSCKAALRPHSRCTKKRMTPPSCLVYRSPRLRSYIRRSTSPRASSIDLLLCASQCASPIARPRGNGSRPEPAAFHLALYSDHHGVFWYTHQRREKRDEELAADERKPAQFGRATRELGIEQVFAWSPQAKGRVERVAGTFQDRLVTELRLADVRSLEEANRLLEEYLPRYNEQFGVPAIGGGSAYRSLPPVMHLADVLCFKHLRKVARDNTVKYQWRTLQLLPGTDRRSYAGRTVEVWERGWMAS